MSLTRLLDAQVTNWFAASVVTSQLYMYTYCIFTTVICLYPCHCTNPQRFIPLRKPTALLMCGITACICAHDDVKWSFAESDVHLIDCYC